MDQDLGFLHCLEGDGRSLLDDGLQLTACKEELVEEG